jgi:hypothetical protein
MTHHPFSIAAPTLGALLGVASITPSFASTSSGPGDSGGGSLRTGKSVSYRLDADHTRVYSDGGYSMYGNNTRSAMADCPNHLTNPYISDGNGMFYDASGTKSPCF